MGPLSCLSVCPVLSVCNVGVLRGQTVGRIKMKLGKQVGPMFIVANGWMDQDVTSHGGRPQHERLCVRWGPSPLPKKWAEPLPNFRPISIVAKRLDASRCHLVWR